MINFGTLQQIAAPRSIANLPQSPSGDSGNDFFGGIAGALQKFSQKPNQTFPTTPDSTAPPVSNIIPNVNNTTPPASNNTLQQVSNNASLFKNAMAELGLTEGQPALTAYLAKANPNLDPAATPWCAGFVGSVLNASGLKGTGSLAAKSYLNYGTPIDKPTQGDIAVLNRGNDPNLGHVGFVQSVDYNRGVVRILGGNQDNSVEIKEFPLSRIAGFRHPPTGQQVAQFAKQNNIQNPQQLSNITKQPLSMNSVPIQESPVTNGYNVRQINPNGFAEPSLGNITGQLAMGSRQVPQLPPPIYQNPTPTRNLTPEQIDQLMRLQGQVA